MKKHFIFFAPACFMIFLMCLLGFLPGCARKGTDDITAPPAPSKTLFEFKLSVAGSISSGIDGSYVVAMDTDGDFSNGPYITVSETTIRFSNIQTGFVYENGRFKKLQYNKQLDTLESVEPSTTPTSSISGNTLTTLWDPAEFGTPAKADMNVFTLKQKQVLDGLGDPVVDKDAKAVHIDFSTESQKSATDAADDVPEENASFNITTFSVRKTTG